MRMYIYVSACVCIHTYMHIYITQTYVHKYINTYVQYKPM